MIGENGAGKTTLMGVLAGVVSADAGEVEVGGRRVEIGSVADAYAHGIGMVHQHFKLFRALTVAENVVMGREPRRRGGYDHAAAEALVDELGRRHGLRVDPRARVAPALGRRPAARGDPARAAPGGRRADPRRADRGAGAAGVRGPVPRPARARRARAARCCSSPTSCARCSTVSDTVTVLRRGVVTGTVATAETGERELASLMVGRAIAMERVPAPRPPGDVRLEADGLAGPGLRGVTLAVRAGEILGVAGVDGNGQTELVETLAGIRPPDAGAVRIDGADVSEASVAERRAAGLAYIPDDRYARGLAREASISDNLLMGRHDERFVLDRARDRRARARARRATTTCARATWASPPRRSRAATRRSS